MDERNIIPSICCFDKTWLLRYVLEGKKMQKDVGSSMAVGGNSDGMPGSFRLIKKNLEICWIPKVKVFICFAV